MGGLIKKENLYANFLLAHMNEKRIKQTALQHGIKIFLYHSTGINSCSNDIRKLFTGLGLSQLYNEESIRNWKTIDTNKGSYNSVLFPEEPPNFEVDNLHTPIFNYGESFSTINKDTILKHIDHSLFTVGEMKELYPLAENYLYDFEL